MGRRLPVLVTACLLLAGAVAVGSPASAARTTGWATWSELQGTPQNYTATMRLPGLSFPEATVRSDSRGGGVGVQSGASSFFNAASPPGEQFGSSEGRRYLNLRPKADTASGASTTTYTFDAPTPAGGWAMVLGDVDADQVTVTALRADGTAALPAELGNAPSFNACSFGSPRSAGCASSIGDVPVWDAASQTLTGSTGTPAFADTVGATGWFRPTVSLRSITLTYTARSGFPVFQTWFAAVNRGISGTIAVPAGAGACTIAGTTVRLLTADGARVSATEAAADGTYSFDGLATRDDYRVVVEPADGCAPVGPRERTVSTLVGNQAADPVADFEVRAIVPQPVSGRVTTGTGAAATGVGGVAVTITPTGGGTPRSTTTAPDGTYLFDENATGTEYVVSIDRPAGFTGDDTRDPFAVTTTPVTGQDFELTALPSVSGTVTGGGGPLGGVQVTATPPGGGAALTTVTAADGTYTFPGLDAGTYTLAVTEPAGYDAEPSLTAVVAGADLAGRDFALVRPGSVGGRVTDADGTPVPGVPVVVDGPGGPRTLTTDADGGYFADDLDAGAYTVTPTAPDGLEVRGDDSAAVTITDAGEAVDQGFVLVAEAVAPPTTPPTDGTTPSPTSPPTDDVGSDPSDDDVTGVSAPAGSLPDTGGPSMVLLALGASTAGAGALVLAGDAVRRRRRA